tara:strand:- start:1057 stop:1275 length:219 start_codon:yes stop_codon:yes gene_type:complete
MYETPTQHQRNRSSRDFYGKNKCISIPYHKLNRLDRLTFIRQQEGYGSDSEVVWDLVDKRYLALKGIGNQYV